MQKSVQEVIVTGSLPYYPELKMPAGFPPMPGSITEKGGRNPRDKEHRGTEQERFMANKDAKGQEADKSTRGGEADTSLVMQATNIIKKLQQEEPQLGSRGATDPEFRTGEQHPPYLEGTWKQQTENTKGGKRGHKS